MFQGHPVLTVHAFIPPSCGVRLWSVKNKLTVAYNNTPGIFLGIPRYCSTSEMFAYAKMPSVACVIRRSIYIYETYEKDYLITFFSVVNSDMMYLSDIVSAAETMDGRIILSMLIFLCYTNYSC